MAVLQLWPEPWDGWTPKFTEFELPHKFKLGLSFRLGSNQCVRNIYTSTGVAVGSTAPVGSALSPSRSLLTVEPALLTPSRVYAAVAWCDAPRAVSRAPPTRLADQPPSARRLWRWHRGWRHRHRHRHRHRPRRGDPR